MPIEVFISYAHRDEELFEWLIKHLKPLEYEGLIRPWSDLRITAGREFERDIVAALDAADVVLLLISPDFVASEYCWGKEMRRALERHKAGEARVIPIICRPVDWHRSPFGDLLALPRNGKAVTTWSNTDEAFLDVSTAIRHVAEELTAAPAHLEIESAAGQVQTDAPRSQLGEYATVWLEYTLPKWVSSLPGSATSEWKVYVDGKHVSQIKPMQTLSLLLHRGSHDIQLRRLWFHSETCTLDLVSGEEIRLECRQAVHANDSISLAQRAGSLYGIGNAMLIRRKI